MDGATSSVDFVTHLDVSSPAIQVEVEVFNFAEFGKLVRDIFLSCLFVNVGDQDDPPLYSCVEVS